MKEERLERKGSGWGVYEEGREIAASVQIKIRCIQ